MASGDAPANTRIFPGLRFFPALGVRNNDTTWTGDASYVQNLYDAFGAPRETQWNFVKGSKPKYFFLAEKKFFWRDLLVDENKAPSSHAEARDPAWSNYEWNHTDVVSAMLEAPAIVDIKARLGLLVALTATSAPDPVPQWMKDKGLTWTDGSGRVHVRQDLEEGWRYMADTMVALVKKYGHRFKIGSLVIGEYFPGPKEERPPDFNFDAFLVGAKNIWSDVVSNAPLDANGSRINIMQVNPMLNNGIVTAADLANLKLGVSGSDPYLFRNDCGEPDDIFCDSGTIDRVRQDLSGVVPLMHQGDATIFKKGESATWTGIANPFGYTAAQVVPIELEHVAWYFGSKGVVPVNSMTIKKHPLLTDDWFSTFDRFGPNGTDAPAWGQLPNRPERLLP